jgi:hypothetical protein
MGLMKRRGYGLLAAVVMSLLAAGCFPARESQRSWTAPPITAGPKGTRGTDNNLSQAATPAPELATPRPTRAPTRQPSPTPASSPTIDPHLVVITEDDVRRSVAAGAAAQEGAQVQGLDVRFTGGKMRITADAMRYGLVSVRDLVLIGSLFAQDGKLQMAVESVQPGGLVGAVIPTVINQALAQYTSQWYVENVRTLDRRLELRIR